MFESCSVVSMLMQHYAKKNSILCKNENLWNERQIFNLKKPNTLLSFNCFCES